MELLPTDAHTSAIGEVVIASVLLTASSLTCEENKNGWPEVAPSSVIDGQNSDPEPATTMINETFCTEYTDAHIHTQFARPHDPGPGPAKPRALVERTSELLRTTDTESGPLRYPGHRWFNICVETASERTMFCSRLDEDAIPYVREIAQWT